MISLRSFRLLRSGVRRVFQNLHVTRTHHIHGPLSYFIPEARTQSSSVRIRTPEKPARVRYVSISCGVEFCVIWGGRLAGNIARWVSNTFQPPSEQRFMLST